MTGIRCLAGKHVVVTGAAGGIGSELARQLRWEHAARLLLVDKDIEGLRRLSDELSGAEPEAVRIFQVDLANASAIDRFCEEIQNERIDALVNNAGIAYGGTFADMNLDDFSRVINVNLFAAVRLTHWLLPKLTERHGSVVNVASAAGLLGPGGMNAYATSKFGLIGFSESLRTEMEGKVGVSVVCPCFVRTAISNNTLLPEGLDSESRKKLRQRIDQLVQTQGMTTGRAARAIIRSIRQNRGLVVVGLRARLLLFVKKCSPWLADKLNGFVFRELRKRGCILPIDFLKDR